MRTLRVPEDTIKGRLVKEGWGEDVIEQHMYPPTPRPDDHDEDPNTNMMFGAPSMWDAFEHILLFISLYVLSISIGLALYFFIDEWFPAITQYSQSDSYWRYNSLRGFIAAIIVAYPLFSFFFWRVTKRTLQNPGLRTLKSRKALIYLTLIITFIIVVCYVIGTIYAFLSGDLTLNFILHFLVTVLISGIIFGYYLQQVKEDRQYAKI
jgi:hypothetical protein